jgi:hypothetical protein
VQGSALESDSASWITARTSGKAEPPVLAKECTNLQNILAGTFEFAAYSDIVTPSSSSLVPIGCIVPTSPLWDLAVPTGTARQTSELCKVTTRKSWTNVGSSPRLRTITTDFLAVHEPIDATSTTMSTCGDSMPSTTRQSSGIWRWRQPVAQWRPPTLAEANLPSCLLYSWPRSAAGQAPKGLPSKKSGGGRRGPTLPAHWLGRRTYPRHGGCYSLPSTRKPDVRMEVRRWTHRQTV